MSTLSTTIHKKYNLFLLGALLCVSFLIVPTLHASEIINEKYNDLKKLEKKEQKYRTLIELKKKEESTITQQIKKIEQQSTALEKDITKNKEQLSSLSNDIKQINDKINKKINAINLQKLLLRNIVRSRFEKITPQTDTTLLFNTLGAERFRAIDNVDHTTARMRDIITLITREQKTLEADKHALEQKKQAIKDVKFQLEERNAHLESTQNYKQVLVAQVATEKRTYTKKLNDVLAQQLAIQSEIDALGTTQIGTFSLADLPSKSDADFRRPVKSPYKITQGYGKTSYSHHYKGGYHNGIDFSGRYSHTIMAAGDGKILATGNMGRYGYGNWIVIDHNNGLATLYGHLSRISVHKGEKVNRGEKIGVMGTTGFSTGTHLHFTVFARKTFRIVPSSHVSGVFIPTGGTVNPMIYL